MGRLAQAMTDSLREGGLLREVIDGLVGNLDRMATYVGVAVTAFGVRYVAAFVAAKVATFTLTGALAALRAALIRPGIGVAVVAVGELVLWLGRARAATGSFGAAFQKIGLQVKAAAYSMKAWFIGALNSMVSAFIDFTWTVADGLNSLFGSNLQGASAVVTQELALAFKAAEDQAAAATAAANALNITLEETETKTDVAAGSMADLGDASGGAAKKIKEAKTEAGKLAEELERNLESAVSSVADAWGDFVVRGFRDFKGFASSVLDSFKGMISQMIAIAARNRLMLGLGLGPGLHPRPAASAAGGLLGGGGGLLGGITRLAGQGCFLGALGGVGRGSGRHPVGLWLGCVLCQPWRASVWFCQRRGRNRCGASCYWPCHCGHRLRLRLFSRNRASNWTRDSTSLSMAPTQTRNRLTRSRQNGSGGCQRKPAPHSARLIRLSRRRLVMCRALSSQWLAHLASARMCSRALATASTCRCKGCLRTRLHRKWPNRLQAWAMLSRG